MKSNNSYSEEFIGDGHHDPYTPPSFSPKVSSAINHVNSLTIMHYTSLILQGIEIHNLWPPFPECYVDVSNYHVDEAEILSKLIIKKQLPVVDDPIVMTGKFFFAREKLVTGIPDLMLETSKTSVKITNRIWKNINKTYRKIADIDEMEKLKGIITKKIGISFGWNYNFVKRRYLLLRYLYNYMTQTKGKKVEYPNSLVFPAYKRKIGNRDLNREIKIDNNNIFYTSSFAYLSTEDCIYIFDIEFVKNLLQIFSYRYNIIITNSMMSIFPASHAFRDSELDEFFNIYDSLFEIMSDKVHEIVKLHESIIQSVLSEFDQLDIAKEYGNIFKKNLKEKIEEIGFSHLKDSILERIRVFYKNLSNSQVAYLYINRAWGSAMTSSYLACNALWNVSADPKLIDHNLVKEMSGFMIAKIVKNIRKKYGKYPKIIKSGSKVPLEHLISNNLDFNSRPFKDILNIKFTKTFEPNLSMLDITKDRRCGPDNVRKIKNMYNQQLVGIKKKNYKKDSRSVILKLINEINPAKLERIIKENKRGFLKKEEKFYMLREKEGEVNHPKPRLFGMGPFWVRTMFASIEKNIKIISDCIPGNMMDDNYTKKQKFHLGCANNKIKQDEYVRVINQFDVSKWCGNMRYELCNYILHFLTSLFGMENIWEECYSVFRSGTMFSSDHHCPPPPQLLDFISASVSKRDKFPSTLEVKLFMERFCLENKFSWKTCFQVLTDTQGGVEGTQQFGWTTVTAAQIHHLLEETETEGYSSGQGDNHIIVLKFKKNEINQTLDEYIIKNNVGISKKCRLWRNKLNDVQKRTGHKLKVDETFFSTRTVVLSKTIVIDGIVYPRLFKDAAAVTDLSNFFICDKFQSIWGMVSGAISMSGYSSTGIVPFLSLQYLMSQSILETIFIGGPFYSPIENILVEFGHCPGTLDSLSDKIIDILELMMVVPGEIGGTVPAILSSFIMTGIPDRIGTAIREFVTYAKITKNPLIKKVASGLFFQSEKSILNHRPLDPPSQLSDDPERLCFEIPGLSSDPIVKRIKTLAQQGIILTNPTLQKIVLDQMPGKNKKKPSDIIFSFLSEEDLFNPLIGATLYSLSSYGMGSRILNTFTRMQTLLSLALEKKENYKFVQEAIKTSRSRFRFLLDLANNKNIHIPEIHISRLMRSIRKKNIGIFSDSPTKDIKGIYSTPLLEGMKIIEVLDGHCWRCEYEKSLGIGKSFISFGLNPCGELFDYGLTKGMGFNSKSSVYKIDNFTRPLIDPIGLPGKTLTGLNNSSYLFNLSITEKMDITIENAIHSSYDLTRDEVKTIKDTSKICIGVNESHRKINMRSLRKSRLNNIGNISSFTTSTTTTMGDLRMREITLPYVQNLIFFKGILGVLLAQSTNNVRRSRFHIHPTCVGCCIVEEKGSNYVQTREIPKFPNSPELRFADFTTVKLADRVEILDNETVRYIRSKDVPNIDIELLRKTSCILVSFSLLEGNSKVRMNLPFKEKKVRIRIDKKTILSLGIRNLLIYFSLSYALLRTTSIRTFIFGPTSRSKKIRVKSLLKNFLMNEMSPELFYPLCKIIEYPSILIQISRISNVFFSYPLFSRSKEKLALFLRETSITLLLQTKIEEKDIGIRVRKLNNEITTWFESYLLIQELFDKVEDSVGEYGKMFDLNPEKIKPLEDRFQYLRNYRKTCVDLNEDRLILYVRTQKIPEEIIIDISEKFDSLPDSFSPLRKLNLSSTIRQTYKIKKQELSSTIEGIDISEGLMTKCVFTKGPYKLADAIITTGLNPRNVITLGDGLGGFSGLLASLSSVENVVCTSLNVREELFKDVDDALSLCEFCLPEYRTKLILKDEINILTNDVTEINDMRALSRIIKENHHLIKFDLVTCDAEFFEKREKNYFTAFKNIIVLFESIKKTTDSALLIKLYFSNKKSTNKILILANILFDEVIIVRSIFSSNLSTEFYVLCKRLKRIKLSSRNIDRLLMIEMTDYDKFLIRNIVDLSYDKIEETKQSIINNWDEVKEYTMSIEGMIFFRNQKKISSIVTDEILLPYIPLSKMTGDDIQISLGRHTFQNNSLTFRVILYTMMEFMELETIDIRDRIKCADKFFKKVSTLTGNRIQKGGKGKGSLRFIPRGIINILLMK